MQAKKQQLEPDLELWAGSKLGKEYIKYITYMQSTLCKIAGWMKHKLESRLPGEISIISDDMLMIPLKWQGVKRN